MDSEPEEFSSHFDGNKPKRDERVYLGCDGSAIFKFEVEGNVVSIKPDMYIKMYKKEINLRGSIPRSPEEYVSVFKCKKGSDLFGKCMSNSIRHGSRVLKVKFF
jgi:hypothetical protein